MFSQVLWYYIGVGRFSDGLILCETHEGMFNQNFESLKVKVKQYHREHTSKTSDNNTAMRQIESTGYGVYYKINSHVIFTIITEQNYPLKLSNAFLDVLSTAFFEEAKCILGSTNLPSRLEAIQGNHYFVRFDRTIKNKKKQFDDPNSMKNVERLKKQLESIHNIMKQNMNMLDKRHEDLVAAQEKAIRINQQSKNFQKNTKKLVWHLWIKKNLIWIVIALLIVLIYFIL